MHPAQQRQQSGGRLRQGKEEQVVQKGHTCSKDPNKTPCTLSIAEARRQSRRFQVQQTATSKNRLKDHSSPKTPSSSCQPPRNTEILGTAWRADVLLFLGGYLDLDHLLPKLLLSGHKRWRARRQRGTNTGMSSCSRGSLCQHALTVTTIDAPLPAVARANLAIRARESSSPLAKQNSA